MFALVPTFYSRVNFLLDRLTVLSDLRYDLARRIFQHRMKDTHARAKSTDLQNLKFLPLSQYSKREIIVFVNKFS